MRKDVSVVVTATQRVELEAIIRDRNRPQKHVWRAQIVLATADDLGTESIMKRTGKSKTCVWRWQERFMREGIAGLLRDKTRPSRIKRLPQETVAQVVALTQKPAPGETT
ncbi:MAG: helix-turn-helix domain-containing protein, partial [Alphaproteobacteria bacterium]|nr:helix-turn-helix domain-containing protein [Alphaproteobacteria bacterium]